MKKYIITLISLFGFCIAQAQAQTLTSAHYTAQIVREQTGYCLVTPLCKPVKDDLSGKANEEREIYSQFTFLE